MPYRINKQTGGMDYVDPSSGSILSQQSVSQVAPQQSGGFLRSAANALIPRTSQFLRKTRALRTLSALTDQQEEDRKRRQQLIEQFIAQAKQETDPGKRSDLLAQAQDLSRQSTDQIRSAISDFEQESGTQLGDKDRVAAEALGVAGELGTFFVPTGKLLQGAKLTRRILKGATVGGAVGAISGITDPEELTPMERAQRTATELATGAAVGGVATPVLEGALGAAKKFLGTDKNRRGAIARLFRVSASERAKFRKSTGGLDFEENILARDAREMSGKNFEQLREHFVARKDEAKRALDTILDGSDKTINKKTMISILKRQLSALSPKKGVVGAAGARKKLQDVIDDLSLIEEEQIPLRMANNIKTDLQNLGDAAFSPTGKSTPISNAMASASGKFKNAIEKVVQGTREENLVKDANRTKQLYDLATRSISKTGDTAAISRANDVVQRLLQALPTVAVISGGVGVGAGVSPEAGATTALTMAALFGGSAAARSKLLSPEVQTKLIGRFKGVLSKQGEERADEIANRIVSEMSKLASRQATVSGPEPIDQIRDEDRQQAQERIGISEDEDQRDQQQPRIDHVPDVSQTVTIRNKKTGATQRVQRSELGNFGLAPDAQDSIPGLPSKSEILMAMVIDAQKGGKNISKLNTILDAYDKVGIDKEEELDLTENQINQLTNLSKSQDIVRRLGDEASKIIDPEDSALRARFKGLSLKALSRPGLIKDKELQAQVSSFIKVRKGMRVQIARGLGEVGNLSEPEQKAALDLLPDINMSQDEIDENIRLIQEIIDLAKSRVTEFSGGAPGLDTEELLR